MWQHALSRFSENTPYFLKYYSRSILGKKTQQPPKFMMYGIRLLFRHVRSLAMPTQATSRQMRLRLRTPPALPPRALALLSLTVPPSTSPRTNIL